MLLPASDGTAALPTSELLAVAQGACVAVQLSVAAILKLGLGLTVLLPKLGRGEVATLTIPEWVLVVVFTVVEVLLVEMPVCVAVALALLVNVPACVAEVVVLPVEVLVCVVEVVEEGDGLGVASGRYIGHPGAPLPYTPP